MNNSESQDLLNKFICVLVNFHSMLRDKKTNYPKFCAKSVKVLKLLEEYIHALFIYCDLRWAKLYL